GLRTRPEETLRMSRLRIFDEHHPEAPLSTHAEHAAIARELARVGVRFEQWAANQPIAPGASQDEVIAAYHADIDRLMREEGVRFFVAGAGQFTLHIEGKVYDVLCEAGDLIGVPDGTRHWFDMSEAPYFVAIRLFTNKDGWVANFTGSDIAQGFPRMEPVATAG